MKYAVNYRLDDAALHVQNTIFSESVKCQNEMNLHDQMHFKMSNFIIIYILHSWSVLGIFCLLRCKWEGAQAINAKVQVMRQ